MPNGAGAVPKRNPEVCKVKKVPVPVSASKLDATYHLPSKSPGVRVKISGPPLMTSSSKPDSNLGETFLVASHDADTEQGRKPESEKIKTADKPGLRKGKPILEDSVKTEDLSKSKGIAGSKGLAKTPKKALAPTPGASSVSRRNERVKTVNVKTPQPLSTLKTAVRPIHKAIVATQALASFKAPSSGGKVTYRRPRGILAPVNPSNVEDVIDAATDFKRSPSSSEGGSGTAKKRDKSPAVKSPPSKGEKSQKSLPEKQDELAVGKKVEKVVVSNVAAKDEESHCDNCGRGGMSIKEDELSRSRVLEKELLTERKLREKLESELHDIKLQFTLSERTNMDLRNKLKDIEFALAEKEKQLQADVKDWEVTTKDFLLCLRSADRNAEESLQKATKLEKENEVLRQRLTSIIGASETLDENLKTSLVSEHLSCVSEETTDYELTTTVDETVLSTDDSPGIKLKDATNTLGGAVMSSRSNQLDQDDLKSPKDESNMDEESSVNKENRCRGALKLRPVASIRDNEKLQTLRKLAGGSMRNALLLWCQNKTAGYANVDITNFSTSWQDGMALAALVHSLTGLYDYEKLSPKSPDVNFTCATTSAKQKLGVDMELDFKSIAHAENPPWESILAYVAEIFNVVEDPSK